MVSYAQIIDRNIVLQNGNIVDNSYKFLDGEILTFHAIYGQVTDNMRWSLNITEKEGLILIGDKGKRTTGGNIPVKISENGVEDFSFEISPDLFNLIDYKKETSFEGDSSVYFTGIVYLYMEDKPTDSLSLFFNVLPSKPRIIDMSLSGNFDFQNVCYSPDASLKVKFLSTRLEKCELFYYGTDSTFNFPIAIYENVKISIGDANVIEFPHANWGEYYLLAPENKYGVIMEGGTISTTACISDSAVCNAILTYQENAGIEDVNVNRDDIVIENNILYVIGNYSKDVATTIYTIDGVAVYTNDTERVISLNFLNRGIYIVRTRLDNKTTTKNIYIQ